MVAKRLASPALLAAGMLIASLGAVAAPASTAAASAHTAAPAAQPGHWSQVTSPLANVALNPEIGLARGTDGVLHVLWLNGAGPYRIKDTPIAADGTAGRSVTVASGWFLATDPDATATPSGLDVFWNGIKTNSSNPPEGTFMATRPRSGGSWSVSGTVISPLPAIPFASSPDTASTGGDGKPWVAYNGTDSMVVDHIGHGEVQISPNSCCLYDAGLATDGRSGTNWVTYLSLIGSHEGIFARRLTNAGLPAGAPALLPGSRQRGLVIPTQQRIGATSRGPGRAGVYAVYGSGYPFYRRLELIGLGSGTPRALASFSIAEQLGGSAVTADPTGQLWVTWFFGRGTRPALFVRRSNIAVTKFSHVRRVPLPPGTSAVLRVYTSAHAGRLEVVALVIRHGRIGQAAYWATQVLPPR